MPFLTSQKGEMRARVGSDQSTLGWRNWCRNRRLKVHGWRTNTETENGKLDLGEGLKVEIKLELEFVLIEEENLCRNWIVHG